MKLISRLRSGLSTAFELIGGLWSGPYWWTIPLVLLLLPAAALFVFLKAVPVVAPFVYSVL